MIGVDVVVVVLATRNIINMNFDKIEEVIAAYRAGEMVVLTDDENRENEGDLVIAASKATPEAINFMATHGRGLICAPITEKRAEELHLDELALGKAAILDYFTDLKELDPQVFKIMFDPFIAFFVIMLFQ